MRKGGGKQKGASFERRICEQLSLWVTDGQKRDCFWRSAMSGGRATVQHRRGVDVRQGGDITAVAEEGYAFCNRYFVELKHYRDLNIASFIICNRGNLAKFWQTVQQQAKRHDKVPMLIAKQNNLPTLVLVRGYAEIDGEPIAVCTEGGCVMFLLDEMLKYKWIIQ